MLNSNLNILSIFLFFYWFAICFCWWYDIIQKCWWDLLPLESSKSLSMKLGSKMHFLTELLLKMTFVKPMSFFRIWIRKYKRLTQGWNIMTDIMHTTSFNWRNQELRIYSALFFVSVCYRRSAVVKLIAYYRTGDNATILWRWWLKHWRISGILKNASFV